jgi:hypothetical protein
MIKKGGVGLLGTIFILCDYVAADLGFTCLSKFTSVCCLSVCHGQKLEFLTVRSPIELKDDIPGPRLAYL